MNASRPNTEIAHELGLTKKQVKDKKSYMRQCGVLPPSGKRHIYTTTDDRFILDNYYIMNNEYIAEKLGVSSGQCICQRAKTLRERGEIFAHDERIGFQPNDDPIDDGYDTVPWWMRQSYRRQYYD